MMVVGGSCSEIDQCCQPIVFSVISTDMNIKFQLNKHVNRLNMPLRLFVIVSNNLKYDFFLFPRAQNPLRNM